MDSRQSQGPPPRPQDRPLIHNPNHHPPTTSQPPPHPSYPQYAPPAASQPPVHVPFADPFQRRDPFLPAAPQRRGSYGMSSRESAGGGGGGGGWGSSNGTPHAHDAQLQHQQSSQQPQQTPSSQSTTRPHQNSAPPPPPPNLAQGPNGSGHVPYAFDSQRRRSLGGASPPQYYAGARDPPPPPPSFSNRHMPPPSSPQQSSALPQYGGQRGPPPPPFSTGRDLPGLVGPPRPSSNMSISSLMGGFESAAASRQSQSHYSPPSSNSAPSPNVNSMQPPSPRRGLVSGGRMDYSYRRAETPDQYPPSTAARPSDRPGYTTGSPPRSYAAPSTASPEAQRQSLPPTSQPYKPAPLQTNTPYHHQPSRSEPSSADVSRPGASSAPPRPNSQPSHPPPSSTHAETRDGYDAVGARRSFFGPSEEERRVVHENQYHGRPGGPNPGDTSRLESGGRERPSTVQPLSHSLFDAPDRQRSALGQPQPANQPTRSLFWHPQPRSHATSEPSQHHPEDHRDRFQHGARSTPGAGPGPIMGINRGAAGVHGTPPENPQRFPLGHESGRRVAEQYQSPPTSDPSSMDRRRNEQAGHQAGHNGYAPRSSSYEYHPKPQGEEMQKSRSFLGVSPEARRTGRASPLPQAVQGAQAQPVVPGGDPNIKNEFGRMFSGLGSGLVSAPSAHGSATPSRGSPFPQNRDSMGHGDSGDLDPLGRTGSRGARRSRKVKDEEGRLESDSNDGRVTPSLAGQRNAKRPKHNHPGHHHHHLYSHHHHHRAEDESGMAIPNPPPSTTPTSFAKMNGVQGQNVPSIAPPAHHHHHHHHAPHPAHHHHHHHHAPRAANNVPPAPVTKPIVEINSQAVLDKVKDMPRYHLGSVVYEATTAPPPSKNTSIDDRYGFRTIPSALPDYTGKENCTLTVRVPRYYLSERQRDVIVVSRQLWGSEIYTHDSDIIATCIHSGWIRGAWPEDVDVTLLDPRINGANSSGNEPSTEADPSQPLTSKPGLPASPPAGFDAHVTVTILPCLTEYKGSVCYGIRSHTRKRHEGCSYKIERVDWVDDETTRRGEERSGQARRERLAAAQSLVALLTSGGGRHRGGGNGDVSQGMRMGQAQAVA